MRLVLDIPPGHQAWQLAVVAETGRPIGEDEGIFVKSLVVNGFEQLTNPLPLAVLTGQARLQNPIRGHVVMALQVRDDDTRSLRLHCNPVLIPTRQTIEAELRHAAQMAQLFSEQNASRRAERHAQVIQAEREFDASKQGVILKMKRSRELTAAERKSLGSPTNPVIRERWVVVEAHAVRVRTCRGKRS